MLKLSLVVITLNAEKHIKRCIDSVQNIVSEIIIVDSGSTDNTCKIAENCGAKVYHHVWAGYGPQKNYATSLASNDWILSLDSDEALSSELKKEIEVVLQNPKYFAYKIQRRNWYCGKWLKYGGWSDIKIRLFHRQHAKWNESLVHETVELIQREKEGKLKNSFLHYAFDEIEEHRRRSIIYAELGGRRLFENGKHPKWITLKLGTTFRFFRDYIIKLGFLDGEQGFWAAKIKAQTAHIKYTTAKKLFDEAQNQSIKI